MDNIQYQKFQSEYMKDYIGFLSDGKLSNILITDIKKQIKEILSDKSHPQYNNYLRKMRKARLFKNGITINSTLDRHNYIYSALLKMKELGITDITLKKIIHSLNNKKFNYYNTINKIKSLGTIYCKEIKSKGQEYVFTNRDTKSNIINNVGGVCQHLAVAYKEFFESKLQKILTKEIKEDVFIRIFNGKDRTHFTGINSNHIYCVLTIGINEFIIDPSFGEISIKQDSGYQIGDEVLVGVNLNNVSTDLFHHNSIALTNFSSNTITVNSSSIINAQNVNLMFLGLLNQQYGISVTYLRNDNTNQLYPFLCLTDYFNNNKFWYTLGDDNESIVGNTEEVEVSKNIIKDHLLEMKKLISN